MSRTVLSSLTVGAEPPVWAPLVAALHRELPPERARELLGSVQVLESPASTLRLAVARARLGGWLRGDTLVHLDGLVRSLSGGRRSLALVPAESPGATLLDPSKTLARFVAGPSNQAAREVIGKLIEQRGRASGPLFVWGPTGAGKTHLLQAVALGLHRAEPPGRVLYRSAHALSLELASAIRAQRAGEVRSVLSHAQALLLDNLCMLAERDATLREVATAIEGHLQQGRLLVLAADRSAEDLERLVPPLGRVLHQAEHVPVCLPEWETRVAIFLDRAAGWGIELRPDVASTLATGIGDELHRVDAVLTRLMLLVRGHAADPNLEHARRALATGPLDAPSASPEIILEVVARRFGLRSRDLRSRDRSEPRATARHVAAYLLRTRCGLSLPQIGRRLGRHHTSALNAIRQTQRRLGRDSSFASLLGVLENEIMLRTEARN